LFSLKLGDEMKLSEIRQLCDEATPGPWEWDYHQLVSRTVDPKGVTGDGVVMNEPGINRPNPDDKKFIAASRTLMPKLLAVAEHAASLMLEDGVIESIAHFNAAFNLLYAIKDVDQHEPA
jgi:hypothetical protein